ncbi:MAG TPA: hypothetical protein VG826_27645 [Pirellulales bacterium]|nr:hypothetical protein [Pirellulales bacterium]
MKDSAAATEVTANVDGPREARDEVPSAPLQLEASGAASQASAGAAREVETSTAHPVQPPRLPWRNAVGSPPPLPPAPLPPAASTTAPSPPAPETAKRTPVRWLAWQRADALEDHAVFRPDPRQLELAYWLASLLPFAAAFCAAPGLPHMQFAGAPGWAQLMLSAAVLHMAYAAWLALLPDESTMRVGMYLFAASAAAYLAAMTAICFVDNSRLSSLGLTGIRGPAVAWCGLVFAVTSLTSGACGWIARGWRTY